MKKPISSRRKTIRSTILASLLFLLCILSYYQLCYSPPKVDQGIARLKRVFNYHTADVWTVKFVPGHDWMASCSADSTVKIWDQANGRVIHVLKHPQGVTHFDISTDGKLIATTSY